MYEYYIYIYIHTYTIHTLYTHYMLYYNVPYDDVTYHNMTYGDLATISPIICSEIITTRDCIVGFVCFFIFLLFKQTDISCQRDETQYLYLKSKLCLKL